MKGRERIAVVDASSPRLGRSIPELPEEETILVRLLRITTGRMAEFFEPPLRDCGLAENQFNVLCFLLASKEGRLPPSELSELVGTSRPNMTRILRELVAAGFVEMQEAERDGRRSLAVITAKGRQRTRQATPLMAEPVALAFRGLSAPERKTLNLLLRKLIVSIDEGAHERRKAA